MSNSKIVVEIDSDLQDLIPQFLENRKRDILTLATLVNENDLDGVAQLAHKIKGTAAGYGFHELSNFAAEMEQAAKAKNSSPLPNLSEQMKNHFDQIEVRFVTM